MAAAGAVAVRSQSQICILGSNELRHGQSARLKEKPRYNRGSSQIKAEASQWLVAAAGTEVDAGFDSVQMGINVS